MILPWRIGYIACFIGHGLLMLSQVGSDESTTPGGAAKRLLAIISPGLSLYFNFSLLSRQRKLSFIYELFISHRFTRGSGWR